MNYLCQIDGKIAYFLVTVAPIVLTNKLGIFRKFANCGQLQDLLIAKNPLSTNSTLLFLCYL